MFRWGWARRALGAFLVAENPPPVSPEVRRLVWGIVVAVYIVAITQTLLNLLAT
jgi:hypothetical protein